MTEVPKIVYDRLRVASPERALSDVASPEHAHPDANLLTAFAEQALSSTERDGVLQHLALCEDCREVLVLALPAADATITAPIAAQTESDQVRRISTAPERTRLTMLVRPSMRWAALAAGVVVAASVLLVHPGKLNQPIPFTVNQQASTTPASSSPVASLSANQIVTKASDDTRSSSTPLLSKQQSPKEPNAERALPPIHRAESGMVLADNKSNPGLAANPSAAPLSRGSTETVAVEVAPSFEGSQMARNDVPAIQKAKPALQDTEATEAKRQQKNKAVPELAFAKKQESLASQTLTQRTLTQNVTWTITAGILQRSQDKGQNWQNALHTDHPLLCYASHGEDVWTGGQAGTIFHSVDSGVTWVQVQPSVKDQKLSSDITHIDIRGDDIQSDVSRPAQIVVSTSNNQVWTSADDGNTWQKN
ncbi:MAG: zf-HC2 domain-containing protein [Terriglobales bacterium]